ncbi:Calcium uniporter protein 4 mitochondrial, partial [Zea mays]
MDLLWKKKSSQVNRGNVFLLLSCVRWQHPGREGNRERDPRAARRRRRRRGDRPREGGGAEGHGGGEGGDRPRGGGAGAAGAVVRADVPGDPDGRVHAAHLLGAVVGRDGAHLLLRHVHVLHGRLRLLPPHQEGAVVRRLLREPVRGQAEARDARPGLRPPQVRGAPESLRRGGAAAPGPDPLRERGRGAGERPLPLLLPLPLILASLGSFLSFFLCCSCPFGGDDDSCIHLMRARMQKKKKHTELR